MDTFAGWVVCGFVVSLCAGGAAVAVFVAVADGVFEGFSAGVEGAAVADGGAVVGAAARLS
ncbi:hypothetical protein ACFQ0G_17875 [Streptomyces chiangmaiensis]